MEKWICELRIHNPSVLKDPPFFLFFKEKTFGTTKYSVAFEQAICWYIGCTSVEFVVVVLVNTWNWKRDATRCFSKISFSVDDPNYFQ